MKAEDEYWRGYVWSMTGDGESEIELAIQDAETLEICEILQADLGRRGRAGQYRYGPSALHGIARMLNQLDWPEITPVTPDFIVFAYDDDTPSIALRRSGASQEQIEEWRKRGML